MVLALAFSQRGQRGIQGFGAGVPSSPPALLPGRYCFLSPWLAALSHIHGRLDRSLHVVLSSDSTHPSRMKSRLLSVVTPASQPPLSHFHNLPGVSLAMQVCFASSLCWKLSSFRIPLFSSSYPHTRPGHLGPRCLTSGFVCTVWVLTLVSTQFQIGN